MYKPKRFARHSFCTTNRAVFVVCLCLCLTSASSTSRAIGQTQKNRRNTAMHGDGQIHSDRQATCWKRKSHYRASRFGRVYKQCSPRNYWRERRAEPAARDGGISSRARENGRVRRLEWKNYGCGGCKR